MKTSSSRITLSLIGIGMTMMAQGQMILPEDQPNRPERGDNMVGIRVNPDIFSSFSFPSGIEVLGIDYRWYVSQHRAIQVSADFDYNAFYMEPRTFYIDENYTEARSTHNTSVNAFVSYLWMKDIGENWQIAFGPQAGIGVASTVTRFDYSHSAQEFQDAGQFGRYSDDVTFVQYSALFGATAELNYFFTESLYLGLTTSLRGEYFVQPAVKQVYRDISSWGITRTEQESSSFRTLNVQAGTPVLLTFGFVF